MGDITFDPVPRFGQKIDPSEALQEEADLVGAFWGFPVVFAPSQPGRNVPREVGPESEVVEQHQGEDLGLIAVPSQALFFDLAPLEGCLDSSSLVVG